MCVCVCVRAKILIVAVTALPPPPPYSWFACPPTSPPLPHSNLIKILFSTSTPKSNHLHLLTHSHEDAPAPLEGPLDNTLPTHLGPLLQH